MKGHRDSCFKIKTITLIFCALIVSLLPLKASSRRIPKKQTGCSYLDKEKPSLFISYERELIEQNNKGQRVRPILLRLHNNSSCSIDIETADITGDETLFRKEVRKLPDGGSATTYIPDPPEGARLTIFYDIQLNKNKAPKPANYWEERDINYIYTVPSGRSVVFAVNGDYFRRRFIISVPFSYSWEDNPELHLGETIQHRVIYFYELPEGFYRG